MKKGQFYLVAILVIIGIFMGIIAIKNSAEKTKTPIMDSIEEELKIEKIKLLEYIANKNLDDTSTQLIFENFSIEYSNKIGKNKNALFFSGENPNYYVNGYVNGENNISCIDSSGDVKISNENEPKEIKNLNMDFSSVNNITCMIGEDEIFVSGIDSGRNIYYLIKYEYNNEVHIISG